MEKYTPEQIKEYQRKRAEATERANKLALALWEQIKSAEITVPQCRGVLASLAQMTDEAERQIVSGTKIS